MSFTFINLVRPCSRELGDNDQPLWIQPHKMTDNCFSCTKPTFWYQVSSINLDTIIWDANQCVSLIGNECPARISFDFERLIEEICTKDFLLQHNSEPCVTLKSLNESVGLSPINHLFRDIRHFRFQDLFFLLERGCYQITHNTTRFPAFGSNAHLVNNNNNNPHLIVHTLIK